MNSLVEKFLDIEEKYDLWNHNIGEFQIWNRTRLELFRMIERFVCGSDIVTVSHRQQFTREGKIYTEEEKRIYVDELVDFYKNTEILIINNVITANQTCQIKSLAWCINCDCSVSGILTYRLRRYMFIAIQNQI